MVDIANPRDISEDVKDLGVKLFNIDDLREIADYNTKLREKEFDEAEIIINEEYILLKNSFKIMEVDDLLSSLRKSMEDIRQRETQKASVKLVDVDGSVKILDNLTNSIVNKIFFDISKNSTAAGIFIKPCAFAGTFPEFQRAALHLICCCQSPGKTEMPHIQFFRPDGCDKVIDPFAYRDTAVFAVIFLDNIFLNCVPVKVTTDDSCAYQMRQFIESQIFSHFASSQTIRKHRSPLRNIRSRSHCP